MDDNEGVEAVPLTLNFRTITGEKKSLETTSDLTLLELKEKLVSLLNVPMEQQRLVYSGRVLKDDEGTLASYNLKSGDTINVAKAASNKLTDQAGGATGGTSSSPSAAVPGFPSRPAASPYGLPPDMSGLLDNPMVRSMLENPQFMQTMLQSDPRIAAMAERNPEVRHLLNDPAFLRQTMETMRNPTAFQEMMRNHDRQLSNIEAIPGGFNYLSSMHRTMEESANSVREENPSTDEANAEFARRLGANQNTGGALPNPWAPTSSQPASGLGNPSANPLASLFSDPLANPMGNSFANPFVNPFGIPFPPPTTTSATPSEQQPANPFQMPNQFNLMQQLEQMQLAMAGFGMPPSATPSTAATTTTTSSAPAPAPEPAEPPEVRFATQLNTLRDMGFDEKDRCIRALLAAGGNVEAAIAYLLDAA
ncbi:hypothetical protein HK097_005757 [Rhizophlyctis rosea]|uniref:Ubiquilin n=1 Tax=Rhizophlyctis rosea TaxID=64517 RepID=A0AAD5SKT1_9FUNG|nr:hypothetical protein HK097_005757 [Rhizophlyctis rosea]